MAPHQARAVQNALSTTAEEILPVRTTRVGATIRNTDASITVYIGTDDAVGPTTGFALIAGASFTVTTRVAIWAEAASGTPAIHIWEEYN